MLARPSLIPAAPGVYAWFFRKAPPTNGTPLSRQTLRSRIRYHYRANTEGSTLRLTLGCLLANSLGIELRRVGSGTRMTFSTGEATLSKWMAANALVPWEDIPAHGRPRRRLSGPYPCR